MLTQNTQSKWDRNNVEIFHVLMRATPSSRGDETGYIWDDEFFPDINGLPTSPDFYSSYEWCAKAETAVLIQGWHDKYVDALVSEVNSDADNMDTGPMLKILLFQICHAVPVRRAGALLVVCRDNKYARISRASVT